jgi:hypothetical protein
MAKIRLLEDIPTLRMSMISQARDNRVPATIDTSTLTSQFKYGIDGSPVTGTRPNSDENAFISYVTSSPVTKDVESQKIMMDVEVIQTEYRREE